MIPPIIFYGALAALAYFGFWENVSGARILLVTVVWVMLPISLLVSLHTAAEHLPSQETFPRLRTWFTRTCEVSLVATLLWFDYPFTSAAWALGSFLLIVSAKLSESKD